MVISTKRLGLAAFIKMKGGTLIEHSEGRFFFEAEDNEQGWEVSYLNSCCYRHDNELVNLRRMINR